MPNAQVTEAMLEAWAVAPSNIVILDTLEIRHPSFVTPIRVVRNFEDLATWVRLDGPNVQPVLDAMDPEDREMVGLVARLEDTAPANAGEYVPFIALAFDVVLPKVDSVPLPETTLTMDNVSREISDALELASQSQYQTEVTYRPYHSNNVAYPQMDPPLTMILSNVKGNTMRVTGRAHVMDIGNRSYPGETYNVETFPGLAR